MKPRSRRGLTLVELLVAMTLSLVIVGAVLDTFLFFGRSATRIAKYQELEQETTLGLELLGRELRMAEGFASTGSPLNRVTLTVPNAVGTGSYTVVYDYDSSVRTLTRQAGGTSKVVVRDILPGTFAFRRYDLVQNTATSDYSTNQLQITMTLAPAMGPSVASATKRVVSSRFVLRNR